MRLSLIFAPRKTNPRIKKAAKVRKTSPTIPYEPNESVILYDPEEKRLTRDP